MRVAGFGHRATPSFGATRVLRRHHACVAHHLPGLLEATEAAKLGGERDRGHFGNPTQSLQRIDDGSQLLGRGIDSAIDGGIEPLDALSLVVDLEDQLDERRILLDVPSDLT
jgi:hypothetical protein